MEFSVSLLSNRETVPSPREKSFSPFTTFPSTPYFLLIKLELGDPVEESIVDFFLAWTSSCASHGSGFEATSSSHGKCQDEVDEEEKFVLIWGLFGQGNERKIHSILHRVLLGANGFITYFLVYSFEKADG